MKRFLAFIYFILLVAFLTINLQAQWENQAVIVPETTTSDPFKVPGDTYLGGIMWEADIDTAFSEFTFLVSREQGGTYVPLYYDDALYTEIVDSTAKAITLKFTRVFAWEWWKVQFNGTLRDSATIYPQYVEVK